ncbi:MAG: hypothetical protein ACTSU5_02940 [Promethearchaeota archaeon]
MGILSTHTFGILLSDDEYDLLYENDDQLDDMTGGEADVSTYTEPSVTITFWDEEFEIGDTWEDAAEVVEPVHVAFKQIEAIRAEYGLKNEPLFLSITDLWEWNPAWDFNERVVVGFALPLQSSRSVKTRQLRSAGVEFKRVRKHVVRGDVYDSEFSFRSLARIGNVGLYFGRWDRADDDYDDDDYDDDDYDDDDSPSQRAKKYLAVLRVVKNGIPARKFLDIVDELYSVAGDISSRVLRADAPPFPARPIIWTDRCSASGELDSWPLEG